LHHDHKWYIATHHGALIQKRGNQWFLHKHQGRGNKLYALCPRVLLSISTLHYIAQVKVHLTSIECIDYIAITQSSIQNITFSCPWRTQYQRPPSHLCRIIGPCPPPSQCFQNLLSSTNIRSASEGSFLHSLGCQGCLIVTLDNGILIKGFGSTYDRVEDTHSYRAELCGNIATFSILNIIRCVYGFTPPVIEHVCDNQSTITDTWKKNTLSVFAKTKPDVDVIMVARSAISELQQFLTVKAFWVRSHADK
jgi:hypothetical protein